MIIDKIMYATVQRYIRAIQCKSIVPTNNYTKTKKKIVRSLLTQTPLYAMARIFYIYFF